MRSIELARERLADDDVAWMRTRRPAARRDGVQCWHGSPRNPVHEYVGPPTRPRAWTSSAPRSDSSATRTSRRRGGRRRAAPRRSRSGPASRWSSATASWLLNPGAVGAPVPPRRGWWDALDAQAADGAFWLLLDLDAAHGHVAARALRPGPGPLPRPALGLDDLPLAVAVLDGLTPSTRAGRQREG